MSFRRFVVLTTVALCTWAAVLPAVVSAHRLPPEVVAFFKADGPRLDVFVRVPTAMLGDARLPVINQVYLDLPNLDPRLKLVVNEVTRSLDVTDHGRPIAPGTASWILSPLGDDSFATYEGAARRLIGPPIPSDRYVYWNEAYVDVHMDYAVAPDSDGLSVRLNGLRLGGDFFQTRATYVPASGRPRTFTITGSPQRVVFEPPLTDALGGFLRAAATRAVRERLFLLLLFCLAIPQREWLALLRQFAAFAVPHLVVAAAVASSVVAPLASTLDVWQVVAGATLVLAAIQNVTASRDRARAAAMVIFGMASGVILGAGVHDAMPLAGSHAVLALTAFLVALEAASVVSLLLLQPLLRMPLRWRAPAWLTLAALSAVPAHEAAHAVLDAVARLRTQEVETIAAPIQMALDAWPILTLVGVLLMLLVFARLAGPAGWSTADGGRTS